MQSCSIWKQWWSCFSSEDTKRDLPQGDQFYDTNLLAAQAAVLKDNRTSMSAASLPWKANFSLSMAKLLVRTPGWPSQAEHCSGGCKKQLGKAENLLEEVTACEFSHSQTRWVWDPNTGDPRKQCWAGHREKQKALSGEMKKTTAQGCVCTSGYCWWLGKSSKHLFPQPHMPRGSTALRAHSKAAWPHYTELLPRTDSVLLRCKRMNIWL